MHTVIHVAFEQTGAVRFARFGFFALQLLSMTAMTVYVAAAAI